MNILIDMNLSPEWERILFDAGHHAVHWSKVGAANAPDRVLLKWSQENEYIVFTHDLDFSAILAATNADGPSVLQVRAQDVSPEGLGELIIESLKRFRAELECGALISVDPLKARARILPLKTDQE